MSTWNDFNTADDQSHFELIPKGTLVKVRTLLRPGGYDNPSHGWTEGYATHNPTSGSVYLNCEYVVISAPYCKRKIWGVIGLRSPNGSDWGCMGRALIKGILNSARGFHPSDGSPRAMQARRIHSLAELDGIEFVAKIDMGNDLYGNQRNVIKTAITPDHNHYAHIMRGTPLATDSAKPLNASKEANTHTLPTHLDSVMSRHQDNHRACPPVHVDRSHPPSPARRSDPSTNPTR